MLRTGLCGLDADDAGRKDVFFTAEEGASFMIDRVSEGAEDGGRSLDRAS